MESKKINQLATELTPALDDITIIGDPTTGISKKITLSQMASLFTGTVEEYANLAAFPLVGVADTIYIALDTNVLYRWDTGLTSYVELSPNIINSLVFSDANGFDGNISLVGSVATLTITTALTTGSVPFIGASGALSQDNANLFFDDTNNRLGVNTNVPTTALDVFGSGIIGRLNGTSTNNSFLGFASAGTNKWSIGNVQSDHRFRIYSEANTAELVSVLQTGEFGIGIANPTTKLHIDGGASALIANLDANVSVAKSISFRSDNSNRINLEVSGTESGSNAGMDFQIKRYSDAGSLIDTPFTIYRSTGLGNYAKDFTIVGLPSLGTGSAGDLAYIGDRTTVNTTYLKISRAGGVVTGIPNIASVTGGVGPATLTFSATAFGFNQSSPKSTLHVTDGNITISKSASGSGTVVGSLDFRNDYASPNYVWAKIEGFNGGTHDSSNISFSTWNGFNSLTERMRVGFDSSRFFFASDRGIRMKGASSAYSEIAGYQVFTENIRELRLTGSTLQFYTGDGSNSTGTERVRITEAGQLTVGSTNEVGRRLYVVGQGSTSASVNSTFDNSAGTTILSLRNDGILFAPQTYGNTVSSPRTMYISSDGQLGGISSIRESKTNIEPIDTNWLMKLNPVSFNYRKKDEENKYIEDFDNELFYGLIAEETELINKEICTYNDNKLIGIEYSKLITPMLKKIQEQEARIKQLESK